jgi:hypothetical protein
MKNFKTGASVKVEVTCLDHGEFNFLDMVVDVVGKIYLIANYISLVLVLSEQFIHDFDDCLSYKIKYVLERAN